MEARCAVLQRDLDEQRSENDTLKWEARPTPCTLCAISATSARFTAYTHYAISAVSTFDCLPAGFMFALRLRPV